MAKKNDAFASPDNKSIISKVEINARNLSKNSEKTTILEENGTYFFNNEEQLEKYKNCGKIFKSINLLHQNKVIQQIIKKVECGKKLCPKCARLRMARYGARINYLMKQNNHKFNYLFLTLTIPNAGWNNLRNGLNDLNNTFMKWRKSTFVQNWYKDNYIKKIEIPFSFTNLKDANEQNELKPWNLHIHLILAVKKSEKYVRDIKDIVKEWTKCYQLATNTKVPTELVCYIEKVKTTKKTEMGLELAKYISKEITDLNSNKLTKKQINSYNLLESKLSISRFEIVKRFLDETFNRRFFQLSGIFKYPFKELDKKIMFDDFWNNKKKIVNELLIEKMDKNSYMVSIWKFNIDKSTLEESIIDLDKLPKYKSAICIFYYLRYKPIWNEIKNYFKNWLSPFTR